MNYPEEVKTYKGYYVFAIYSSMFEIPNTKELREEFETQKNNSEHRKSTRARVLWLYGIKNEFMVDAIITDCGQGEKNYPNHIYIKLEK